MADQIQVAAGSVAGREHTRVGKNNQDAWAWLSLEQATVAVICDGCGSAPCSEVGAQAGARIAMTSLVQQLPPHGELTPVFWAAVQQQILTRLGDLAQSLGDGEAAVVQRYLLFTLLGVVLTPVETVVFGVGDGVFAINGVVYALGPFAHNAPPYVAYQLLSAGALTQPSAAIQVHHRQPTATVQSLLLGSDGVLDLIGVATQPLPGRSEPVGDLSQFWQPPYFQNPDRVRRRLALINREVIRADWDQRQVIRQPGLLPDDTTLITIRRQPLVV